MSLSKLFLILTLLAFSMIGFGWLNWSIEVVYWLALITGVLMLLEELAVVNYSLPTRRRND